MTPGERAVQQVDAMSGEIVECAAELVRIPTVNPPGEHYREAAEQLLARLVGFGYQAHTLIAEDMPEHTRAHPRVNVWGELRGRQPRPVLHLNGHLDVVPPGSGWTEDPFGGTVRDGKLIGRGASDMKAGIAAGLFAVEAIRRAGLVLRGTVQQSFTVDEESGGWAGVAWLCRRGLLTRDTCDYLIIPEPLGVDRICLGHRGALWLEVTTLGHVAHGSMPFLGVSAIDQMTKLLGRLDAELRPRLAGRITSMPVEPPSARCASLNVNALWGGQVGAGRMQTPCVVDRCTAVLDRRFLAEESVDQVRRELLEPLADLARGDPSFRYQTRELMVIEPVWTDPAASSAQAVGRAVHAVLGREPLLIASPGTYDQKHAVRIGGLTDCLAYGPGILEQAHQPDEYCRIEDLMLATKVLALSVIDLLGVF